MLQNEETEQKMLVNTQDVISDKENAQLTVAQSVNTTQESVSNTDSDVSVEKSTEIVIEIKSTENQAPESMVSNEMEVTETTQGTKSSETEVQLEKSVEMETVLNEAQQKEIPEEKPTESISSDTVADNDTTQINSNNDVNMDTDNAQAISTAKPTEAAKPIGSLGLLGQYASSSDEDEDSGNSETDESESEGEESGSNNEVLTTPAVDDSSLDAAAKSILDSVMSRGNYRDISSDSSDTETDDSEVECIGTIPAQTIDITNDDDIQEFLESCDDNTSTGPIKAKGELGIEDLPPIEELTITVAESDCVELGKISGVVETLVLVESLPNFAAVDIDTVLFLEKGNRTLGQVFDVMGNVSSPIYCVRFNSAQDIVTKNITNGLKVYVAPQTQYTNFIVLKDLMKERGCDASWEYDVEAPDGCSEFSDDEEERLNRRQQTQRNRNRNRTSESSELPAKVTVKSEPNAQGNQPNAQGNRRRPQYNNRQRNGGGGVGGGGENKPTRFYKDNRGYANPDPGSYYHHHHHQQQRMQPGHHNYSWHTAAMHGGMPPPSPASTSSSAMQFSPYAQNHGLAPNMYPNPFAMQANQMNYASPFSLQAFPPLPPPINTIPPNHLPPHHQLPQYNRHRKPSGGSFQHK